MSSRCKGEAERVGNDLKMIHYDLEDANGRSYHSGTLIGNCVPFLTHAVSERGRIGFIEKGRYSAR